MPRTRGTVGQRKAREGWWCRYFDRFGRRHCVYGGADEAAAREHLDELLAHEDELAAGKIRDVSLGEFAVELWPLVRRRLAPKSFEALSGRVLAAAQHFGLRTMRTITRGDAEAFLAGLRRSPRTVTAYRSALSVAWKAAIRAAAARENVWAGQPVPRPQQRAVTYVDEDGLRALVRVTPRRIRPFVAFLAETGMRRGEALNLRWEDVGEARLRVRRSKTGRIREVPITARLRAILDRLPRGAPGHRVFRDVPRTWPKSVRALWRRAKRRAKLPPSYRLYDLRHARASLLVRAGVPVPTVAAWLGCSAALVLSTYGHHAPANALEAAVAALETARGTPRRSRSSS